MCALSAKSGSVVMVFVPFPGSGVDQDKLNALAE